MVSHRPCRFKIPLALPCVEGRGRLVRGFFLISFPPSGFHLLFGFSFGRVSFHTFWSLSAIFDCCHLLLIRLIIGRLGGSKAFSVVLIRRSLTGATPLVSVLLSPPRGGPGPAGTLAAPPGVDGSLLFTSLCAVDFLLCLKSDSVCYSPRNSVKLLFCWGDWTSGSGWGFLSFWRTICFLPTNLWDKAHVLRTFARLFCEFPVRSRKKKLQVGIDYPSGKSTSPREF